MMQFRGTRVGDRYALEMKFSPTATIWLPLAALPQELTGKGNRFGWGDTQDGSMMASFVILREIGMVVPLAGIWMHDFCVRFLKPIPWDQETWTLNEAEIIEWLTECTVDELTNPVKLEHLQLFWDRKSYQLAPESKASLEVKPD